MSTFGHNFEHVGALDFGLRPRLIEEQTANLLLGDVGGRAAWQPAEVSYAFLWLPRSRA